MGISIIIPFYNEEQNVDWVLNEIREKNPDAEIIAVTDGSTDGTLSKLQRHEDVKLIAFSLNQGKGFAICEGIKQANHESCVLIDGDGQYDPAEIQLMAGLLSKADLVCGYRPKRFDKSHKIIASKIANFVRKTILDDIVRDTGCGIKALKRSCASCLVPFEGTHRFIPTFFKNSGYSLVEIGITHRPRVAGSSKYTIFGRTWRGVYDLLRVRKILKRRTHNQLIHKSGLLRKAHKSYT